ncbi:FAD-dependent oxidoreductase [Winogradskyella aquimaris]|uniref:Kynurenine 3-monooxygenase n=1 Tax=Winogradskyella aquimaris TaxID=864074 RepID=A0ABU5ELS7_9FLAO|nr:NAD(P)/FAD-dependent oxidoreductase [Winogradskyella aquimaris]MDY2587017.1 NAD(P)/FAD-dependent oxidoreductase [Winogradskyella aquimaris]
MKQNQNILIIGAGLCGSLLALRLAQRGYNVNVYESRPDLRVTDISAGRSINLALSDRGFKALRLAGVENKAREICIPMKGRLMHDTQGNTFTSNYSGRDNEFINSISRGDLNGMLLTEADKYDNLTIHFNTECESVDLDTNIVHFVNRKTKKKFKVEADVIFGTDGAGSELRKSYFLQRKFLFSFSQNFLTHGYKELEIPAAAEGSHQISKDYLHIWPRGEYMLIALPNLDGSFTVTLFLGHEEGEYNFKDLDSEDKIKAFFQEQFPDALALIPNIAEEFENNPTGPLGTIKCSPWYYKGNTLILGDAAHAVVPFYGQGMNASFEDVAVLDGIIDKHEGNWETIFKTYESVRKADADAIGELAEENYYEMRDHVANPIFKKKRQLEIQLEKHFPEQYFSKYSMVTFNENIGYHEAMTKGRAQDKAILNMIADNEINLNDDLSVLLKIVQEKTNDIIDDDNIAKTMHH